MLMRNLREHFFQNGFDVINSELLIVMTLSMSLFLGTIESLMSRAGKLG